MNDFKGMPGPDNSEVTTAPRNRFVDKVVDRIYAFLSSSKLAMALLIAILSCCVIGVTIFRGQRAGTVIFSALWFNALLVLLVVNVGFCFFGRKWGRKLTVISLGMILFHLSFVAILGGIVYNSLFYFRGSIRLTEGETLPNGQPASYDYAEHGYFFNYSMLKGDTTLIKMYTDYKVDGADKKVAYEIAVGEGGSKKQGLVYITHHLDYNGFRYFRDKEGYSPLIILYDKRGREIFGAFVSLQSFKQKDDTYFYTSGTKEGPGSFPFPQEPLFYLQVAYHPDPKKERGGDASFHVWPHSKEPAPQGEKPLANGKAAIGARFDAGEYYLSAREVRYWVAMSVRYDPGLPIVLGSLWAGLGGMVITFIGRIAKRRIEGKAS